MEYEEKLAADLTYEDLGKTVAVIQSQPHHHGRVEGLLTSITFTRSFKGGRNKPRVFCRIEAHGVEFENVYTVGENVRLGTPEVHP